MDERAMATMLNVGRTSIGLGLLAPRPLRRYLVGDQAETPSGRLLRRMTAVREIALGLATLEAIRRGTGVNTLLRWGAFVDAVDSLALFAARGVPATGRLPLALIAPSYAAAGAWLTSRAREE